MNNKYVIAENLLLDASKATLEKQGVILSADNYYDILSEGLKNIIEMNKYNNFTNDYNYRRRLEKFYPSDFVEMICNKLIEYGETNVVYDLYSGSNDGKISVTCLERCIRLYSNYVTSGLDELYMTYSDEKTVDFNDIPGKLQQIKFYPPSDACREAIMSGKQTQVQYSSVKNAGMMAYSDVGKVRKNQEDSYYIGIHPEYPNVKLMLVADGMGGCAKGEVASNIAAKEMIKWFESLSLEMLNDSDYFAMLAQSEIEMIHDNINDHCYGGGTTLCFSIITDDGIFMGNVGDSRGFVTKNDYLEYATKPDSLPFVLGVPEPFDKFHSRNNVITNCLGGTDDPILHYANIVMDKKSTYDVVLCSDGVTDCLSNDVIVGIMRNGNNVAHSLVTAALYNNLSFKEELTREKKRSGIFGRHDYKLLLNALENEYGMPLDLDKIIHGGKDNATAVYSGDIKRGR